MATSSNPVRRASVAFPLPLGDGYRVRDRPRRLRDSFSLTDGSNHSHVLHLGYSKRPGVTHSRGAGCAIDSSGRSAAHRPARGRCRGGDSCCASGVGRPCLILPAAPPPDHRYSSRRVSPVSYTSGASEKSEPETWSTRTAHLMDAPPLMPIAPRCWLAAAADGRSPTLVLVGYDLRSSRAAIDLAGAAARAPAPASVFTPTPPRRLRPWLDSGPRRPRPRPSHRYRRDRPRLLS